LSRPPPRRGPFGGRHLHLHRHPRLGAPTHATTLPTGSAMTARQARSTTSALLVQTASTAGSILRRHTLRPHYGRRCHRRRHQHRRRSPRSHRVDSRATTRAYTRAVACAAMAGPGQSPQATAIWAQTAWTAGLASCSRPRLRLQHCRLCHLSHRSLRCLHPSRKLLRPPTPTVPTRATRVRTGRGRTARQARCMTSARWVETASTAGSTLHLRLGRSGDRRRRRLRRRRDLRSPTGSLASTRASTLLVAYAATAGQVLRALPVTWAQTALNVGLGFISRPRRRRQPIRHHRRRHHRLLCHPRILRFRRVV